MFNKEASAAETQHEYDACVEYDQKLISAIGVLKNSMLPVVGPVAPTDFRNQIKLPQLPLPQSGHLEGEDFNRFLTGFEHIINKYNLSSCE